jgi:hypothetical protein
MSQGEEPVRLYIPAYTIKFTLRCGLPEAWTADTCPSKYRQSLPHLNAVTDKEYIRYDESKSGRRRRLLIDSDPDQTVLAQICMSSHCCDGYSWHVLVNARLVYPTLFKEREAIEAQRTPADDLMADQISELQAAIAQLKTLPATERPGVGDIERLTAELSEARRPLVRARRTNTLAAAHSALTGMDELLSLSQQRREALTAIEAGFETKAEPALTSA